MYKLFKKKDNQDKLEYVLIENKSIGNTMKVFPKQGGALHHLTINNKLLIKESSKSNKKGSFFSSILFPYANRVENGKFSYNGTLYSLPINENNSTNAIHGLVYNKEFEIVAYSLFNEKATITLRYTENYSEKLPFKYTIDLTYEINHMNINLNISICNKGEESFPFSLGWHPYFYCQDNTNRVLKLQSNQKATFNSNMILNSFKAENTNKLLINKDFDDCYKLTDKKVFYTNNQYSLTLTSSSKVSYLQIFTPQNDNSVAIEFMTSPPNSFNNKLDLLTLNPKETYDLNWSIDLKKE